MIVITGNYTETTLPHMFLQAHVPSFSLVCGSLEQINSSIEITFPSDMKPSSFTAGFPALFKPTIPNQHFHTAKMGLLFRICSVVTLDASGLESPFRLCLHLVYIPLTPKITQLKQ